MQSDELTRAIRARCVVTQVVVEVGPPVRVVLHVASHEVSGAVTLDGVADLSIRPTWTTWSLDALEFTDISARQFDGVSVQIGAGQDGFMSCLCASVSAELSN